MSIGSQQVTLEIEQQRCSQCSSACLKRLFNSNQQPVVIPVEHFTVSPSALFEGQRIGISFSTGLLLGLSSLLYLVPVVVMLLFVIGLRAFGSESELILLIGLVAGLATGVLGSNLLVRSIEANVKKSLICNPVKPLIQQRSR